MPVGGTDGNLLTDNFVLSRTHLNIGLLSLLRKIFGEPQPKPQTEAYCKILVKCEFGRDVVC